MTFGPFWTTMLAGNVPASYLVHASQKSPSQQQDQSFTAAIWERNMTSAVPGAKTVEEFKMQNLAKLCDIGVADVDIRRPTSLKPPGKHSNLCGGSASFT